MDAVARPQAQGAVHILMMVRRDLVTHDGAGAVGAGAAGAVGATGALWSRPNVGVYSSRAPLALCPNGLGRAWVSGCMKNIL